jgi:hypothetical protein
MTRLAKALEAFPQVCSVETNLHTGTLIVHHKKAAIEDIQSELKDMGVILMAATGVELSGQSLVEAVSDLDGRLSAATGGVLNLKLLVPLGLGTLAVVQLLRRGFQFEGAPWYLLAYLAFESFIRLRGADGKQEPALDERVRK